MNKKRILLIALSVILLAGGFFSWKVFGPSVKAPDGNYFYIRTGSVYETVKKELLDKEIIRSGWWFDKLASQLKYKNTVKPGRYEIKQGMSLLSLVRMLKNGRQAPVDFLVKKTRTREDFARRVGENFECDSAAMLFFLNRIDSLHKESGLDSNTVMAAVIPDTYTFFWNTTPERIFQKLYAGYKKFWNEDRKAKAAAKGLTPMQVSILGSIVEEETAMKADKGNISSVYLNRVKKGMPLQADPTLKFAARDFKAKRVWNTFKEVESPYNTYKYKGLPPGPICTPSQETLNEVLNAPQTDYIFFVASYKFDGSSLFTSNYADHMKYARMYQDEADKRGIK
jgi:UPF0755 protein